MPKLGIYSSGKSILGSHSRVFQTFGGQNVESSLVTPFIRRCLKYKKIRYEGTVTDFRRAAASLTGQYKPHLAEVMSLFLGQRRRAHDKYYRIQFGHFGLVDAFVELEKLQKDPFMDKLVQISAVTHPTVSSLTTSVDSTDISNSSTLVPQNDLLSHPLCTSISKFVINSSTLSSLINSISDKSIVSPLSTNCSNLSFQNISVLDNHCRSIVSERYCFGGRRMSLKEFSIRIPRLDVRNL